jgi:hypothetical protein
MEGGTEGAAANKHSSAEELYFTKDGRLKPGAKAPSAYAWSYPWPPSPTNLNKNQVFRPKDEENQELVKEVQEEFEKESKPLKIPEKDGTSPLSRMPVPDIELAVYWERHPYEFRPEGNGNLKQRSKSAMNLSYVSTVGELLTMNGDQVKLKESSSSQRSSAGSKRSSVDSERSKRSISASPKLRKNSASNNGSEVARKDNHIRSSSNAHEDNHKTKPNSKSSTPPPKVDTDVHKSSTVDKVHGKKAISVPKIMQILSTKEKRTFDDIPSKRQSHSAHKPNLNNYNNSYSNEVYKRPQIVREVTARSDGNKSSVGVQASLEDISVAALKSTYLCPLHGQYNRGVERRSKNGFRTDMSSTMNPHARCSRSRTKLVKNTEIQTDDSGGDNSIYVHQNGSDSGQQDRSDDKANRYMKGRSKTAGPRMHGRGNTNNMLSEYNRNYRQPAKVM